MMKFNKSALVALLVAAASPAIAADYKGTGTFSWTYAPQSVSLSDALSSTAGIVYGTTLRPDGPTTATQCTDVDQPTGASSGTCVETDADGDKWMNDWSCEPAATTPPGVLFACEGQTTVIGGTGKYGEAKGTSTFTIYGVAVLPDGTVVGYTTENYDMSY